MLELAEVKEICWNVSAAFSRFKDRYCVLSRFVAMAGSGSSPKEVVTGAAEGEGTPQKEVIPVAADGEATPQRDVITVPGEGELEKRSPSPMTPGDHVEETMVSEPAAKRVKLEMEISGLATKVEQACESMNGLSAAMIQLCDRFSKECKEVHSGLQSMGLQGATNKGLIAAIVQYEGTLQNISWQISGSGKSQTNNSLKAISLALGDKIVAANQTLRELSRTSGEQHKSLIEQLQAIETAIKTVGLGGAVPSQGHGKGEPSMPSFPVPVQGQGKGETSMPSFGTEPLMTTFQAMPMPQRPQANPPGYGAMAPPDTSNVFPPSAPPSAPAVFPRRAYRVVVQTGQGSAKVRAISPSAMRATETPSSEWFSTYGLGDVVIRGWRHRVLPDSFINDAVQYPDI